MKLIIIRHGETEENKDGIVQGHLNGTLSKLGVKQTRKVAERFKDEKIDKIFSSDLARASDTAKEISKFHPETSLEFVKNLRERYLGVLEGNKAPVLLRHKKWDSDFSKRLKVETPEEIFKRAKNFIDRLLMEHYGKVILLVAHHGINQVIITYLLGKSWRDISQVNFLRNTSVTIFEFDKNKKPILKLMDCVEHLE